jgi:hypothetical protein
VCSGPNADPGFRLSRWRKNDLKHSTICRPGEKSRSSYIQLFGQRGRRIGLQDVFGPDVLDLAAMRLITLSPTWNAGIR